MRIFKLAGVAIAALLGLVIVVAAVLILRFDPNDYKPELTALLQERSGRTVTIGDDIGWSLFPWLAIETGDVTVGNHPEFDTTPFATIDSLSARIRVWPLLRREIELGLITIDGLTLDVGTNAAGTANWSDLQNAAEESPAAPADPQAAGSGIAGLQIAGIRLSNGRVLWRELGEVRYIVSDADITTGAIALGEPVAADAELTILDVASQRRVRMAVTTTASLSGDDVRLADLDADATLIDADGNERGTARLVTESLTVAGGERVTASAGSITGTAVDLPFGAATLDARIEWPSLELDTAAGSARVENIITEVNGIVATWTVDAENLADSPTLRGQVDIPPVAAERLLATAGIAAPEGIDPAELGNVSGRGRFVATTAGEVTLEDFTLELLGLSARATGGVTADSQLDVTVAVPRFAPTDGLRSLIAARLPNGAALDAVTTLGLDTRIATDLADGGPLTLNGLRLALNDATLAGDITIEPGDAAGYAGTANLQLPDPALLRGLLGDTFPANLDPAAIGPTTLEARFRYVGASDVLTVPAFELATFGLEASGNLTANNLGTAPVVRGRGTLARFDPRAALERLDQPAPQTSDTRAFRTAAFAGDYVIDADHAEFSNMTLDIDDMRIAGAISIENFEAPRYRFDLTTDALDVDRYLPPRSDAADAGERTAGDIELASEPLERLDLSGTARVGTLKLANLEFQQVAATLTVGDGRATIMPARTRLYGGEFDGSLAVDTTGETPTMQLSGRTTNVALQPLITALTGEANVRGTGNFDIDLTGTGETVTDALRTAAGTLGFSLTGGAIDGFNLGRTLCAAYNLRERLPKPAAAPDSTGYELIRASAEVRDGIATTRDMLARTPFMDVTGTGRATLADAHVDYDMVAVLTAAVPIGGCETMTEFVGDSIPFTIEGPLSGPAIEPDYREIVRSRIQEEVRESVEDRVRERLQDRLRDLL